jgi:hypothetical protein
MSGCSDRIGSLGSALASHHRILVLRKQNDLETTAAEFNRTCICGRRLNGAEISLLTRHLHDRAANGVSRNPINPMPGETVPEDWDCGHVVDCSAWLLGDFSRLLMRSLLPTQIRRSCKEIWLTGAFSRPHKPIEYLISHDVQAPTPECKSASLSQIFEMISMSLNR